MSKIVRYAGNLRAFGSNAQGLERTVFGETTQADDLTSQITTAFLRGWGIVGPSENPSLEDFNAAMYAVSQFIAYQHQMGVPEWHAEQEYYIGSICTLNGESYQSLEDNNVGSAPPSAKWTTILTAKNGLAKLGLGDGSGRYLGTRVFTASGTYTPTAGTKKVVVTVVGGGGGGGGTFATNASQNAAGAGGGGGAEAVGVFTTGFSGVAMVIGSAGVSAAGANGTDGGVTSFGTLLTAAGGGGGPRGLASTIGNTSGSAGGVTVTGTALIVKAGQDGSAGTIYSIGTNLSGKGGDTNYGYGGSPGGSGNSAGSGSAGNPGKDYGSGGAGAVGSISDAARSGGSGRPGVIIVVEYA